MYNVANDVVRIILSAVVPIFISPVDESMEILVVPEPPVNEFEATDELVISPLLPLSVIVVLPAASFSVSNPPPEARNR